MKPSRGHDILVILHREIAQVQPQTIIIDVLVVLHPVVAQTQHLTASEPRYKAFSPCYTLKLHTGGRLFIQPVITYRSVIHVALYTCMSPVLSLLLCIYLAWAARSGGVLVLLCIMLVLVQLQNNMLCSMRRLFFFYFRPPGLFASIKRKVYQVYHREAQTAAAAAQQASGIVSCVLFLFL